jgi:hypothetical protein
VIEFCFAAAFLFFGLLFRTRSNFNLHASSAYGKTNSMFVHSNEKLVNLIDLYRSPYALQREIRLPESRHLVFHLLFAATQTQINECACGAVDGSHLVHSPSIRIEMLVRYSSDSEGSRTASTDKHLAHVLFRSSSI